MVTVEVTDGNRIEKFRANTAAELLPSVLAAFGEGPVVEPDKVILTAGSGALIEGRYVWRPKAGTIGQFSTSDAVFLEVNIESDEYSLLATLLMDTGCSMHLLLSEYKIRQLGLSFDGTESTAEVANGRRVTVRRYGAIQVYVMVDSGDGGLVAGDSAWLECYGLVGSTPKDALAGMTTTPWPLGLVKPMDAGTSCAPDAQPAAASSPPAFKLKLSPVECGKDKYEYDAILGFSGMRKLRIGIDKNGTLFQVKKGVERLMATGHCSLS